MKRIYGKMIKALRILWEKNVKIMTGTDLPNFAHNQGISIWEEIQGYIEAGLSLWDALKTATGYASETLGLNIGTIRENSIANLLLYEDKAPLIDKNVIPDKIIFKEQVYDPKKLLHSLEKNTVL